MSTFLKLKLIIFSLAVASYGDTMVLKSGEELEVEIESFDGTTYNVLHYYSKSIKTRKQIAAADVSEIKKGVKADVADFAELEKILPVPDGKSEAYYEKVLLGKIQAFRDKHKLNKYKKKVAKIEDEVLGELEKVREGFKKIDGEFVAPEELEKTLYNTQANALKDEISTAFEQKRYLVALRKFEAMKEGYSQTEAYQTVSPEVGSFLEKFRTTIEGKIANPDVGLDEEALKKLSSSDASRAKQIYMNKREKLEARIEVDMKNREEWVTVDTENSSALKKTLQKIDKTLKEIDKAADKDFVDGGKLYEDLYQAIEEEDLDEAKDLYKDFKRIDPPKEIFSLISDKYDALDEKVEAMEKAEKEAERAEKLAIREAKIAEREAKIAERNAKIAERDAKFAEKKAAENGETEKTAEEGRKK